MLDSAGQEREIYAETMNVVALPGSTDITLTSWTMGVTNVLMDVAIVL